MAFGGGLPGAGMGGGGAAAWQALLAGQQVGTFQQELARLVSSTILPIVRELATQPQVRRPRALLFDSRSPV